MSDPSTRTVSLAPDRSGLSLPRLYFALLRQRFTGTLVVQQRAPAGERTVWFRGGMPVFTDWVSDQDRLGQMLLEAGLVDQAGLDRALAAHASGNGPFGDILVDLGLIDSATRTELLREQCVRRLVRSFAAEAIGPEARVWAGEHNRGQADALGQINVLALLLRAIGETFDNARVEAEIGAQLGSDLVATPALARYERQFGFAASDAPILAAVARGTTMARLMTPGVDPRRALHVVYALWVTQMLRLGDDATQAIASGATAAAAAQQLKVASDATGPTPNPTPNPAPSPAPPKPRPQPAPRPPAQPARAAAPPSPPPEPEPEPELEPEPDDGAFEGGLAALEAKIADQAHAFALFGLELDADRKQVREVWAELSRTYHPDGLEGAGRSRLRERVERVFAALSEAYGVLSDKDQRERLAEALAASGGNLKAGEDTATVVRNAFEAERLARDADKLLLARDYVRAADLFGRAHALSPKDSDIEAALAYAEFRRGDAGDARTAIARLVKVIDETPNCARAFYFKGLLEVGLDETAAAKQSFASAHKLDPRNVDAERQLRALKLRERDGSAQPGSKPGSKPEPKDDKKRGFGLRDLFGKK